MNSNLDFEIAKIEKQINENSSFEGFKKEIQEIAEAKKIFENYEVFRKLILKFKDDIEKINKILLTAESEILPDKKRDVFIAYKRLCINFLNIFDFEERLKNLKKIIDNS